MPPKLKVLDIFSGIGGFSLGLERTQGFETVAFCEVEPFCRLILARHWPGVPCFPDVAKLRGSDVGSVDVITGGFPCQDISGVRAVAGAGLNGKRSGLWFEMRRVVEDLRPAYVIIENSPRLRAVGLDVVLSGLDALGYDAEWHCIPATYVGAPHERDRVWVVAYAHGHPPLWPPITRQKRPAWPSEPQVPRVVDGIPDQPYRRHALGNAVVPGIPELIGRAILQARSAQ
jgi:DNA (cytosine-5)-methyltransferase 1